ncbi:MAG: hypothetical protein OHK0029_17910 [Armatimonadaceae bacterium]
MSNGTPPFTDDGNQDREQARSCFTFATERVRSEYSSAQTQMQAYISAQTFLFAPYCFVATAVPQHPVLRTILAVLCVLGFTLSPLAFGRIYITARRIWEWRKKRAHHAHAIQNELDCQTIEPPHANLGYHLFSLSFIWLSPLILSATWIYLFFYKDRL